MKIAIEILYIVCVSFTDMDGLGSSAVGGQMVRSASGQSPLAQEKHTPDSVTAGKAYL